MSLYRAPQRGTRELKSTGQWKASQFVFDLLEPHCHPYRWPIRADNDRDHIPW